MRAGGAPEGDDGGGRVVSMAIGNRGSIARGIEGVVKRSGLNDFVVQGFTGDGIDRFGVVEVRYGGGEGIGFGSDEGVELGSDGLEVRRGFGAAGSIVAGERVAVGAGVVGFKEEIA